MAIVRENPRTDRPEHSPLGASGASRWMKCPGSVGLSYGVEDPESDFAALGTAAHTLGETCLRENCDAWVFIGSHVAGGAILPPGSDLHGPVNMIPVDQDMANAVQVYLDAIREWHPERNQGNSWIERSFHCPSIHELFYGRSDYTYLDAPNRHLHVWDYKHGAGIVVEVEGNPQGMYYACGVLEDLMAWEDVDKVTIHIAQPRGFHWDGPIRSWTVTTDDLQVWLEDELIPAMERALVSRDTASGEHCRFCPARSHACPQLMADMEELEKMISQLDGKGADALTNKQVGRLMKLFGVAKIVNKAAEQTAFARMNAGHTIPGFKLAAARAFREWKDGAEAAVKKKFGKRAYTEPALKSPAQIDQMPEGKALTAQWAMKPDKGLTVVPEEDARRPVSKTTKSLFKPTKKGGKK